MINPNHLEAMADWLEPYKGERYAGWCFALANMLGLIDDDYWHTRDFLEDLYGCDNDLPFYMANSEKAQPGTRVTILRELAYALRDQGFAE